MSREIISKLIYGDCLVESGVIESGSVDLIITDPPYGTVRGLSDGKDIYHGMSGKTAWDVALSPSDLFEVANRILRRNGKLILFSQEPYTSRLITESVPNLPFSYRMVWEKDHFANSLLAKTAPVSYFEDIVVFSKTHDTVAAHPLRSYFKSVMSYIGLGINQINKALGHRRAEHVFYVNSTQFSLCTSETYDELIDVFGIDAMIGFKPYNVLRDIDLAAKSKLFPSVFNLWEGGKYKSNILRYKKDYDGYHPTQKPVLLIEDLIKTFSNEGDSVVDLTMGSGSTGVAAANTGRSFTGFEKDKDFFEVAKNRIEEAERRSFGNELMKGGL